MQVGEKKEVLQTVSDNSCPVVFYNATLPAFTRGFLSNGNTDMIVAIGGGNAQFSTVMADYLYNERGYRKVFCFKQDTITGNNNVDPFVACFEGMGGQVISNTPVNQGTEDWSQVLASVINSDAEAIVGWTAGDEAIAFYKEWYNSGAYAKYPVFGTMSWGFTDSNIISELSEEILNALIATGLSVPVSYIYSIDSSENKAFMDALRRLLGYPGGILVRDDINMDIYLALKCFIKALDSVGPDAGAVSLADAMRSVDFYGPSGHVFFEKGSTVPNKDIYIATLRNPDGTPYYKLLKHYPEIPQFGLNYDGEDFVPVAD